MLFRSRTVTGQDTTGLRERTHDRHGRRLGTRSAEWGTGNGGWGPERRQERGDCTEWDTKNAGGGISILYTFCGERTRECLDSAATITGPGRAEHGTARHRRSGGRACGHREEREERRENGGGKCWKAKRRTSPADDRRGHLVLAERVLVPVRHVRVHRRRRLGPREPAGEQREHPSPSPAYRPARNTDANANRTHATYPGIIISFQ